MRILCIVAVAVALTGVVALAPRSAVMPAHVTPTAFIDLGAIFGGSENEPDENEPDDGTRAAPQAPARHARISVLGVLLSAAGGALAALWIASRVRRLRARLRRLGERWSARLDRRW
jgi:predicted outer membrane lipoprotein